MVDGIRAGADGLRVLGLKLDTLAGNLANVSTSGYRKSEIEAVASSEEGSSSIGTAGFVDLTRGELAQTNNPLDVALEGDGFFTVGSGDDTGYTRDGRFAMDMQGNLVTAGGQAVQGQGGPIKLDPLAETSISADGAVSQRGRTVDRLKIAAFNDNSKLVKASSGLLVSEEEPVSASAPVKQGFVEGSNVRMVEEMASMMKVMRSFEGLQRAMTTQDNATGKMISTMGRFS